MNHLVFLLQEGENVFGIMIVLIRSMLSAENYAFIQMNKIPKDE